MGQCRSLADHAATRRGNAGPPGTSGAGLASVADTTRQATVKGSAVRITAIVNSKGGTGKTTTAVNLATSAALAGQRVLLVDLDKQGSATQWLDHSPDNDDLMTALIDGSSLDPFVVSTPVDGLELVPASITLAQTERLTVEPGHQYSLRDCLAKTTPRDWVFLDAP